MKRLNERHMVVLVDDEPEVLSALKRSLAREPYLVLTTSRPKEALRWVESLDVSAVVRGLIAVIRDLYSSGTVREAFGRDIPVTLMPQDEHARFPEWKRQISPPDMYTLFGPYYESIWSEGWPSD